MSTLYTTISKMRDTNLSIIPLIGGDDPQRGKTPAVRWSKYAKCLPTSADLSLWFEKHGYSAYGVVCGSVSQLVVLDLDDPDVAQDFAQKFPDLMKTLVVRSGLRGTPHIYWRVSFRAASRKVLGGDLKGEGGYVVGPGSKIAGFSWDVVEDAPIRIVMANEFQTALAYLTKTQPPRTHNTQSQITSAGAESLYWSLVARTGMRNDSLFKTACRVRDEGWPLNLAVDTLADAHVSAVPYNQQARESPASRYAEAAATIRSAYSRPARPEGEGKVSRLPGSLREALLARPDGTAILRVVEGLHLAGMSSGETFTEREALERLRPIGVGRHSLLRALPVFKNAVPLKPPAVADKESQEPINETQTTKQKKCFFVSTTKTDKTDFGSQGSKRGRHRPPQRYCFPDVESLCRMFGVKPSGGDAIQAADVASVKTYRQALERTFIQRKPGEYFADGLAERLHRSVRTIQRYHRALEISSEPTFQDQRITRQNFRDVLMAAADYKRYQVSRWGHFLEDETGKRYPPYREIAGKLLKAKHTVFYRKQRANFYWIDECHQRSAVSGLGAARAAPLLQNTLPHQASPRPTDHIHNSAVGAHRSAPNAPPQHTPQIGRPGELWPPEDHRHVEHHTPAPAKPRESKRKYRQEMADSGVEMLAKSVQKTVRELAPSERAMSLANARRLVETYGAKSVARALNKLIWMAGKGKIQNPAGFMITVSRQQWRIDNNATGLGDPAPEFKGEPARRPRSRPKRKTDAVHKSERWLTNRIEFELGQGNLEQVEHWEAKLDELVKSRTLRWYRWRVHFARENENPQSVRFWRGFLNRKMGIDEF